MNFIKKIKNRIKNHKIISILVLIIVGFGVYYGFFRTTSTTQVKSVLAKASVNDIVNVISGSGQIYANNQSTLTSSVSGKVTSVSVIAGKEVKKGDIIATIDNSDALLALENARLEYNDLVTIDPDTLNKAENTLANSKATLKNSYLSANKVLAETRVTIKNNLTTMDGLFGNGGFLDKSVNSISPGAEEYRRIAENSYYEISDSINALDKEFLVVGDSSNESDTYKLLVDTESVLKNMVVASKNIKDSVDLIVRLSDNGSTNYTSALSSANNLNVSANTLLNTITSQINSIASNKRNVTESENSLNDINNGPKQSEIIAKQITLKQKQDAYDDHFIRAPFDGVIGKVYVNEGDDLNSGSSVAIVISKNNYASITLNEVDVAKVKIGQKAKIILDAISNKKFDAEVSEVDLVGAVSQGVVSYDVKVSIDNNDSDIKPGMSATADITYGGKTGIITVPNSAIKTQGKTKYVELVTENITDKTAFKSGVVLTLATTKQTVEVGEADDDNTEIISGLKEGDIVVSQSINTTSSTKTSSLFNFGRATGGAQRP